MLPVSGRIVVIPGFDGREYPRLEEGVRRPGLERRRRPDVDGHELVVRRNEVELASVGSPPGLTPPTRRHLAALAGFRKTADEDFGGSRFLRLVSEPASIGRQPRPGLVEFRLQNGTALTCLEITHPDVEVKALPVEDLIEEETAVPGPVVERGEGRRPVEHLFRFGTARVAEVDLAQRIRAVDDPAAVGAPDGGCGDGRLRGEPYETPTFEISHPDGSREAFGIDSWHGQTAGVG
jgi:hypothetical protein